MSTTFAPTRTPKPTRTAKPARPAPTRRKSYTEHRRAARRNQRDKSLRAQLVKGRSLVNMAVAVRDQGSRWPFFLVIAFIAGVSVVALLMLNTATAQTSFTERQLNDKLSELTYTEQQLQQQVAAKQAPGELAKRAAELGMQPGTNPGNLVINPDGSVSWVEPKAPPAPPAAPAPTQPAPADQAAANQAAANQAPAESAPADQGAAGQAPVNDVPPTTPNSPGA